MSRHLQIVFALMFFLFPNVVWSQTTSQVTASNTQADANTEKNYKNVDYYYEGSLAYKEEKFALAIEKLAYFLGANQNIITKSSRLYAAIIFAMENCRTQLSNPPRARLWLIPLTRQPQIPGNLLPDHLYSKSSK